MKPSSKEHSLHLRINHSMYETLADLVESSNASCTAEVLRNAIALYSWANKQSQEGYTIGCFDKEGKPIKEVILPFISK